MTIDFRNFIGFTTFLAHSAKGSEWKEHKYISKETTNGKTRYLYTEPSSKVAREIASETKKMKEKDQETPDYKIRKYERDIKRYTEKMDELISERQELEEWFNTKHPNAEWIALKSYNEGRLERIEKEIEEYEQLKRATEYLLKYEKADLSHSAKGSEWKEHKYIKRIDGTYYYPDNYEGGRHLPDGSDNPDYDPEKQEESFDLSDDEIDSLAKEVIRGNFGNGQTRKELLGENYQKIQRRVNEMLKDTPAETTPITEVTDESVKQVETIVKSSSGGLDMETVYKVYRNK